MNRVDVCELETYQGNLSISIYAHCARRGGCIASLNRLSGQAADHLKKLINNREADEYAEKLRSLEGHFAIGEGYDAVALFINKHISWVYPVIQPLPEQVFIQKNFVVSPVTQQLYRLDRYWILGIFHGTPYLFEGYATGILEVYHRHASFEGEQHVSVEDAAGLVCSGHTWGKKCRYRTDEEFMQHVDRAFRHFMERDPLPYVCIVDDYSARVFMQHSSYADQAIKVVHMTHQLSREELYHTAWRAAEPWFHQQRRKTYQEVRDATQVQLCVWDIPRIWHYLHDDSVRSIAVKRTLKMPGCEDRVASAISLGEQCHGAEKIDAIDALLDTAHRRGIPVVLFDEHELDPYNGVAAVITSGQESPRD
jgi:hypothetical protein